VAEEKLPGLAQRLVAELKEDQRDREPLERRWLEDYRMYMGIYDPGMHFEEGRSRIYFRTAKVKADTVVARLMDILFPRAGDRNWEIQATPEPYLGQDVMGLVDTVRQMQGDAAAKTLLDAVVKQRIDAMTKVMADQLAEAPDKSGYRATMRKVVRSAAMYGMGVHKGPLVDERTRKTWKLKAIAATGAGGLAETREAWVLDESPVELRPYFRDVVVWNVFWDMTAKDLQSCRRFWEEYLMVYGEVVDLAKRKSFFGGVIREYLQQNRDGDAVERTYESELRLLGDKNNSRQIKNRFRVVERWGWLRGDELQECGVEMGDDPLEEDYFCNVWLLGDRIIKAVRAPLRGVDYPYQIFCLSKDESGLCGESIPRIMRHQQEAYAAIVRAMIDNASISAGPIVGVNTTALSQSDDPGSLHAFKILKFEDTDDMKGAIAFFQAQSRIPDLLAMLKAFEDAGDNQTVPRWVNGDGKVSDAAKTLGGLSMLMSAMSVNLAEMIKIFDDDVTSRFITALYHWNMDFNSRADIKGDYNIKALGSTALMAKEVQSQRLIQFLQIVMQSPDLLMMTNVQKALRAIAVSMEIPEGIIFDDATIEQNKQKQMQMQVSAEQQSKLQTLLDEMNSRGIPPDQSLQQLLAQVLTELSQGQATPGPAQQPQALPAQGLEVAA